jgi:hypothetical protein
MLALDQDFGKKLVVFENFWDFERLVKDEAPRRVEIAGSRPFCGFFGNLGFM